ANVTNGFRRLPALGNAGQRTFLILTNLLPGVTYYWSVQALDTAYAGGAFQTNEATFTTLSASPLATTLAASSITSTSAVLNGLFNPDGAATVAWFQYGLTTNYSNTSSSFSLPATNAAFSTNFAISGLSPGTLYHFQAFASNSLGSVKGADVTFTTLAGSP